jgi:uncharacterized protein (TIGR04255 family)
MTFALYPSAGNHSVQNAAFAIEWLSELTPTELSAAMAVHAELSASLPQQSQASVMSFQIGPNGQPQMLPSGTGGFTLFRPAPAGGVSRSLEVDRMRCVAQVNDYTRWKAVWPEVRKWFAAIIPKLGRKNFSSIGIQFNDVFHWRDRIESFDPAVVFSAKSTLLPSGALSSKQPWHSHHGYFVAINEPINVPILENVNINVLDNLNQRSVIISTVHKASVNMWSWEEISPVLDQLMEALHLRNKAVLADLLTEEAAKIISLNAEAPV